MNARSRSRDWILSTVLLFVVASCSGNGCGGCGGLGTIPNGFPSAKRTTNAAQIRVSSSGLAALTANPAALLSGLVGSGSGSATGLGSGTVAFPVPSSCSSPDLCCPNGVAATNCGPLTIDLNKQAGDADRLDVVPVDGTNQVNVTIRARIKSESDIPFTEGISCGINFDSTRGTPQDVVITTTLTFSQDGDANTTRMVVGTPSISIQKAAIVLDGTGGGVNDLECAAATALVDVALSTVETELGIQVQNLIQAQLCKPCPGGTTQECGEFADSCSTDHICMEATSCLQELGLDGRALASTLFGSFSPNTTGGMDLYEVAGGYATTNSGGLALGLLAGMEPAGQPRDMCGPAATEPTPVAVAQSPFFQGNTRPDTGDAFDVAIGLHKSQLDQLAFAGYNGGLFCLNIGHDAVDQLSTTTLNILSRSLGNLNSGPAPVAIGLRPQSPPVFTLGRNTFTTTGGTTSLTEPLLDIKFTQLQIDFFVSVNNQYIRAFTVTTDLDLPLGLQVGGMGELTPVIGGGSGSFTNLTVSNSAAVTESPAMLAASFPAILNLVLPQLNGGLAPITLPAFGNLDLSVNAVTAVPQNPGETQLQYLAIFANLTAAKTAAVVHTHALLTGITEPAAAIARDATKWASATPPSVTLALSGDDPDDHDLEFSYRIDSGWWSAWDHNANPTISSTVFWLAGTHDVEVRARHTGVPRSIDRAPALVSVELGPDAPSVADRLRGVSRLKTRATSGGGCACDSSGGPGVAAPFALLVIGLLAWPRRKRARGVAAAIAAAAGLASIGGLGGCGNGPCGSHSCKSGEVARGALGQWTSIAADGSRVMVATYDQGLGDLVAVDITDMTKPTYVVVDGIPPNDTPTFDPGGYRGGVSDAGPDVGAYSSILLAGGSARIAYQDRDASTLKYAFETAPGKWTNYTIDSGGSAPIGQFASLALDGAGKPAIAYLAVGVDDGAGHRLTELRLARANATNPTQLGQWTITQISSSPGSCGGLCPMGESCVVGATATDPDTCATPATNCTVTCAGSQVCVAGVTAPTCRNTVAAPDVEELPTGTGLFVNLHVLSDGRLVATYYDRTRKALIIGVESAAGSSTFAETVLDGNAANVDRGMWASSLVDASDVVHIAYQDGIGQQLMYTNWNAMTGAVAIPEVVDDGTRTGDRPHPVGQSASIYNASGTLSIAYQDGANADVMVAARPSAAWALSGVATGPLLDGFSIATTTGHGTPVIAWDSLDPTNAPPNSLAFLNP